MKKYLFHGTLTGPTGAYDYAIDTTDTEEGFKALLAEIGHPEADPRFFLGWLPAHFPAHEEWPPLTGKLLVDRYYKLLAETLSEDTGTKYAARELTEIPLDKLDGFLRLLTEDVSVEDTTPADPYYIYMPFDHEERLAAYGVSMDDIFSTEE